MKRILFYVVLAVQVGIIALLGWQYFMIDQYGNSVKLLLEKQDYSYYYSNDFYGDIYLEYEINTIPRDKWDVDNEIDYNEKVYVLLEKGDDDIYHVEKASTNKLESSTNQIVFVGKYQYSDSTRRQVNHVNYGIEKLINKDLYQNSGNSKVVTLKVSPWGQKKVVSIGDAD